MSYKTILVYVNSTHPIETIERAANLAERSEAHLIGLYVTPPPPVYASGEMPMPVNLDKYHRQHHEELSEKLKSTFERITSGRSFVAEWRNEHASYSVEQALSELAKNVDLLITGRSDEKTSGVLSEDELKKVISDNARPTMIIPNSDRTDTIGSRILVAWDGDDVSTRAVFDALPLLKSADKVRILHINPTSEERHQTLGTSSELVNTLARHGVNAELSFSHCSISEVAEELLRNTYESEQIFW